MGAPRRCKGRVVGADNGTGAGAAEALSVTRNRALQRRLGREALGANPADPPWGRQETRARAWKKTSSLCL